MASRPILGSKVLANDRAGEVAVHDRSDTTMTYKVCFADGSADWFKQDDVWLEGTERPIKAVSVPAVPTLVVKAIGTGGVGDPTTFEEFFKVNKYFPVPWVLFMAALYLMRYVPMFQAYFDRNGMQPYGLASATKLMVYGILCSYALHGWIAVNHDVLMKKGLKILPSVPYKFQCGDASTRATWIFFFGMMTYAFVPMRMAPAATWGQSSLEFLLGYVILLVGHDAWFFCVHYAAHTPSLYKLLHKKHHTWKHPVSFSAYFITSGSHLIQEHAFVVLAMLFLPVPWTAFWFYQYYGAPASLLQHCGFNLSDLKVPFCGPLKLENLESACGLGLGHILGAQSTASHDYHHETFMGNFQLSYTYLDRMFGLYVDTSTKSDAHDALLGV
jgi:sterol desaturase/sphingolipid hydroxylase (fatty acid hydroxylase superfamily)